MGDVLVLGLGNILLQDEGIGVRVIERFQDQYSVPAGVQVLDGGVRGLALLSFLEGITKLLIVDAVQNGQEPGTLIRLAGAEVPAFLSPKVSLHQEGLADLLWAAIVIGGYPEDVVLWGVGPAVIETGLELSPVVSDQVDTLVERVREQLVEWGYTPRRRVNGGNE